MLPQRSTTSTWQVSPRVVPCASTVGSPMPAPAAARPGGRRRGEEVGEPGRAPAGGTGPQLGAGPVPDERPPLGGVAGREQLVHGHVSTSPYQASRSAIASFTASTLAWTRSGDGAAEADRARGPAASTPSSIASAWSSAGPCDHGPAFASVQPAPVQGDRRLVRRRPAGQVLPGQKPGVGTTGVVHHRIPAEPVDLLGDESRVPGSQGRVDLRLPGGSARCVEQSAVGRGGEPDCGRDCRRRELHRRRRARWRPRSASA